MLAARLVVIASAFMPIACSPRPTTTNPEIPAPLTNLAPEDIEILARFKEWLEHPLELARPADRLEIIDKRTLKWPAGDKAGLATCWLIRYSVAEEDGSEDSSVGIAGPVTWCMFWDEYVQMTPEDLYGCYAEWDMGQDKLSVDVDDPTDEQMREVLNRWKGPALEGVRIRDVQLVQAPDGSKELVGLAEATSNDEPGWAVFDGPASRFYPDRLLPKGCYRGHVIASHIGRRAIGLTAEPDRETWKRIPAPKSADPELVVRIFERQLDEVKAGRMRIDPFDAALSRYARTLRSLGRAERLREAIALLETKWEGDSFGANSLGCAAYEAGLHELALPFLETAFKENRLPGSGKDASMLARLLVEADRREEALAVLLKAMKAAVSEARDAHYFSDRWSHEEWYQGFRSTFLELFPDRGPAFLASEGLPASTRPPPVSVPAR